MVYGGGGGLQKVLGGGWASGDSMGGGGCLQYGEQVVCVFTWGIRWVGLPPGELGGVWCFSVVNMWCVGYLRGTRGDMWWGFVHKGYRGWGW
uniref:Transmembrane protein n=1 Tax=Knipowitschia caucasica TaxID=637954 RepID=A0AAV2M6R3_KNICA